MRARAAAFAVVTLASLAHVARAQSAGGAGAVNDADRAAARDLFIDGVKLQEAGKFLDALDRFKRAQSVVNAPTHLLHIAECDAALGRLVEAAETYRTLARTNLAPGAPTAFIQARQQGAAELTSIEPRIGSLKITVTPETAPHLAVAIDGQPMSVALLGAARPTDPGPHTITVTADGYAKSEQAIALKEKEQKPVAITLQSAGGLVGVIAVPQASQTSRTPQPASEGQPFDKPPVYYAAAEETRHESASGFMIGPRLGMSLPGGKLYQGASVSDFSSAGLAFGAEAGFRFARHFYLGATFEHATFSKSSTLDSAASSIPTGYDLTFSSWSNAFGFDFAYVSNTEGVGFWGELGVAYRWLGMSPRIDDHNGDFTEAATSYSGGELSLGVGVYVKLSDFLRIVPKVTLGGGSFTKVDVTCSTGGTQVEACNNASSQDIAQTDTHTFVFLGATTYFDFSRH